MKAHSWAARLVALALVFCLTGCESCLTGNLWSTDHLHHTVRPVGEIKVFYSPRRKDYLLAYEADGRFGGKERQIFLGENIERLETRQKPRYASEPLAELQTVPVNRGTTNPVPSAIVTSTVVIHTELGPIGPYPLPAYDDGAGTPLQVILTPFAVAGDLALFGLILGVASGIAYAAGSCVNCSR